MQLTPDNNIGITSSMQGRVSEGVTVFWIISLYYSHRTRKVASQSMCGPGQDIAENNPITFFHTPYLLLAGFILGV